MACDNFHKKYNIEKVLKWKDISVEEKNRLLCSNYMQLYSQTIARDIIHLSFFNEEQIRRQYFVHCIEELFAEKLSFPNIPFRVDLNSGASTERYNHNREEILIRILQLSEDYYQNLKKK